jgi:hypothetical protein
MVDLYLWTWNFINLPLFKYFMCGIGVAILVIFYWGWKEDGKDRRDTNWSEGE